MVGFEKRTKTWRDLRDHANDEGTTKSEEAKGRMGVFGIQTTWTETIEHERSLLHGNISLTYPLAKTMTAEPACIPSEWLYKHDPGSLSWISTSNPLLP